MATPVNDVGLLLHTHGEVLINGKTSLAGNLLSGGWNNVQIAIAGSVRTVEKLPKFKRTYRLRKN